MRTRRSFQCAEKLLHSTPNENRRTGTFRVSRRPLNILTDFDWRPIRNANKRLNLPEPSRLHPREPLCTKRIVAHNVKSSPILAGAQPGTTRLWGSYLGLPRQVAPIVPQDIGDVVERPDLDPRMQPLLGPTRSTHLLEDLVLCMKFRQIIKGIIGIIFQYFKSSASYLL